MTESETGADVPAPEPAAAVVPTRRRRGRGWLWLGLILLAAAGYAYWQWQQQQRQREAVASADAAWQRDLAAFDARLAAMEQSLNALRDTQRGIEQRLADAAAGSKVLREEVLGVAERAAVLEDALTRLARRREDGELALRLNEVDYLLQLGEERLRLFGDTASAAQAFALADASLASIDEPAYAALRQTLQIELNALRDAPPDPRPALRSSLAEVARGLEQLPLAEPERLAAESEGSRLRQLLGSLITVRRLDAEAAALTPLERATALASLRLQLGLALAALEGRDGTAFRAALDAALVQFDRLFAESAAAMTQRARLAAARDTELAASLPELGASLRELRALRATRALGSAPAPAEPASATPAASSSAVAEPDEPLPELERPEAP